MSTSKKDLFTIKKNQLEMIKSRGYDVSQEEEILNYSLQEFIDYYTSVMEDENIPSFRQSLSNTYRNADNEAAYVYYADVGTTANIGVDIVRDIIDKKNKITKLNTLIVVSEVEMNAKALEELRSVIPIVDEITNLRTIYFQLFLDEELRYNPTKHVKVPKHTLLTQDEVSRFLEESQVKLRQLPLLKYVDPFYRSTDKARQVVTDPIVKYYGFRPGQVIGISRDSTAVVAKETFIGDTLVRKYDTYRLVSFS